MRRALVAILVGVVLAQSLMAAATSSANIKDRFDSIGWAGSNGSLPWSGPWGEIGDDGDEKKGSVRVVSSGNCADGNCIRISGLLAGIGAGRSADTSQLDELSLCYDLNNVVTLLPLGLSQLQVQVWGDGSWTTVATYNLGDDFSGHYTHELSDEFRSEAFQVRFKVIGAAMISEVYVDNVELEGELVEESTTTTTSSTTTTTEGTTTTTIDGTTTTGAEETITTTRPRATTTTA
ncbi:MAG TPA: hypothetical protein VIH55_00900, partial [Acidimicrobiia bacterium]